MKALRIILTGIFSLFSVLGIGNIVLGNISVAMFIVVAAYLTSALALNNKGGKPAYYIAIFTGAILCIGFVGAIYAVFQPMLGQRFEPMLFFSALIIGLVGFSSLICLLKNSRNFERPNT